MKKGFFLILIFALLAFISYLYFKEGTLPVNKNDKSTKIFVVPKGESLNNIIKKLSREQLIRNRIVFYLIVKQLGIEKKIQAGDYRLSPSMDAYQIAKTLTHGTLDIWITIIEGLRKEEVAQIVGKNFGIPEIEFIKKAKEGFLFPDTYLIPKDATLETIIKILENNFQKKVDEKLKNQMKEKGLSLEETIIIASLIEREAKFEEDRPLVASVIFNRLNEKMKLEIDATVQYALGYQADEKTWWKKNLTKSDLEIDSLYNTYKFEGLPPGPICSPGLSSIKAVINAPNTDYLFYISDKNGKLHFAKDLPTHNKNIQKYLIK